MSTLSASPKCTCFKVDLVLCINPKHIRLIYVSHKHLNSSAEDSVRDTRVPRELLF